MSVKENTFCSAMFGNILWPAISLPCYAHDSCHIDKKISFQISRDNETAINDNFLKHVALGNSPRPTASGCCQATCFRKLSLIVSYYHCLGILLLKREAVIRENHEVGDVWRNKSERISPVINPSLKFFPMLFSIRAVKTASFSGISAHL